MPVRARCRSIKIVTKVYESLDNIDEGVRTLEQGEFSDRSIMVYAWPDQGEW